MRRIFQFLSESIFEMRLKRAIRKADSMHRMTGHKYIVLRWKNTLVVKSKKHIKLAIKRHELRCTIRQVEEMALYITN